MNDKDKTKVQLIEEIAALRERNAELESQQADHQHSAQIQAALYRIADAASAVEDMQEFYATIHQIVGELMYTENFFIALYHAERQQIRFVYMIDTVDEPLDSQTWYPLSLGSTGYVLRTGKPMLSMKQYDDLVQTGEIVPSGTRAYDGAVVPLEVDKHTIGVLAIQSHIEGIGYSDQDKELLIYVAQHIATALENARLFDELQTRNREIAETLQQQTATSEILRAMAGSPGDVQPVFDAIAKNAANLGGTAVSTVYRYDGQMLHVVAMHNLPPENVAAVRKAYPRPLTRDVGLSAMSIIDRTAYNVADVEQDPRVPEHMVKITLDAGMRSVLFVPMIRQNIAIGAIGILRREAGAFTEKQIALLNTFADQAIIAIENVELFNETNRLLAESKAQVAELSTLNIISEGLVGQLDLQSVIDLVGDQIREIIDAEMFGIALYDSESSMFNFPYFFLGDSRVHPDPIPLGEGLVSTVIQSGQPLMLDTMQAALHHGVVIPKQLQGRPPPEEYSWLGVPILIGQEATGVIYITKHQNNAFTKADEQLLSTIAANMGVAIENARLFERIQQTNQELSQTLEELRTTQGQLVEAEKMAALGGLVAGVAHEINTPVGVGVTAASTLQDKTNGFSEVYKSGQMKRSDLEKYLSLAEQSSAMILRNLERAAELIQSFKQVAVDQSSEERRQFPVKAYLEEILLSLRPKLKKTQHTIEINGDDSLTLDSYPGAFSQIVTNLVMNSLLHAYGPDEWGQLTFDLKQNDGGLIFEYNDDGKGIPTENLSKIFEPFFTTKRTQGGTGLGLHIIYNLVTQRLGGTISCESKVGSGTKFIIEVPIA